jgi:hypothetical protein
MAERDTAAQDTRAVERVAAVAKGGRNEGGTQGGTTRSFPVTPDTLVRLVERNPGARLE